MFLEASRRQNLGLETLKIQGLKDARDSLREIGDAVPVVTHAATFAQEALDHGEPDHCK